MPKKLGSSIVYGPFWSGKCLSPMPKSKPSPHWNRVVPPPPQRYSHSSEVGTEKGSGTEDRHPDASPSDMRG